MKKIHFFATLIIIAIGFNSCYKENDRDMEIYNTGEEEIVQPPDTFHSPCDNTIAANTLVFDNSTITFKNYGWHKEPSRSNVCIIGRDSYTDETVIIYFNDTKPTKSKIYNVSDTYYNDENTAFITYRDGPYWGYGVARYQSIAQGQIYLNVLGDSISATFCNITFALENYPSITNQGSSKITWK